MKLPNGYGSVVELKGNRREPYAVRVSVPELQPDGTVKRKRKYLAYFTKPEAAYSYLADLNNGNVVKEHTKHTDTLTFSELYDKWKKFRNTLKNKFSKDTWRNYDIAFERYSSIHHRKITTLKANNLQEIIPLTTINPVQQ